MFFKDENPFAAYKNQVEESFKVPAGKDAKHPTWVHTKKMHAHSDAARSAPDGSAAEKAHLDAYRAHAEASGAHNKGSSNAAELTKKADAASAKAHGIKEGHDEKHDKNANGIDDKDENKAKDTSVPKTTPAPQGQSKSKPDGNEGAFTKYKKTGVEEASKDEEEKFHQDLDKMVHKTFGKSKDEMQEGNPCWDGYKKVPGKKDFEKGSCVKEEDELEEKRGLWDNIHAKRKRIKNGSGERMRKPGSEGAPSEKDLKDSQVKEASEGQQVARRKDMATNALLQHQSAHNIHHKTGGRYAKTSDNHDDYDTSKASPEAAKKHKELHGAYVAAKKAHADHMAANPRKPRKQIPHKPLGGSGPGNKSYSS